MSLAKMCLTCMCYFAAYYVSRDKLAFISEATSCALDLLPSIFVLCIIFCIVFCYITFEFPRRIFFVSFNYIINIVSEAKTLCTNFIQSVTETDSSAQQAPTGNNSSASSEVKARMRSPQRIKQLLLFPDQVPDNIISVDDYLKQTSKDLRNLRNRQVFVLWEIQKEEQKILNLPANQKTAYWRARVITYTNNEATVHVPQALLVQRYKNLYNSQIWQEAMLEQHKVNLQHVFIVN